MLLTNERLFKILFEETHLPNCVFLNRENELQEFVKSLISYCKLLKLVHF